MELIGRNYLMQGFLMILLIEFIGAYMYIQLGFLI